MKGQKSSWPCYIAIFEGRRHYATYSVIQTLEKFTYFDLFSISNKDLRNNTFSRKKLHRKCNKQWQSFQCVTALFTSDIVLYYVLLRSGSHMIRDGHFSGPLHM